MRNAVPFALMLTLACATATPPAPLPTDAPYGMTIEEEARILALEDRRELDHDLVDRWIAHPNPAHRLRMVMALARIGPHTFIDANENRFFDPPTEKRAGVEALAKLVADPDRRVREAVSFSLGEIGDAAAAGTLFSLTTDADANVPAEAVEALSKLPVADKTAGASIWDRYAVITREPWAAGIRARAVRYTFRFDSDAASTAAMSALGAASDAVRQEAAYSLARRAFEPARAQLELLMNERNVLTRAYATTALGRIGSATSMPLIVTALGDAHPWVRTNAAIAAGRIAEKDRAVLRADDLPRIFAVAEDPDPGVRASIIDVVGYYGETNETARARLLTILRNGTQWERELAAGAIAKHFTPDTETFKALGDDLSSWARLRVIEATENAPHGPAIRAKYWTNADALVRAAVVGHIPDARVDAEADIIRKAIADPDVVVRATRSEEHTSELQSQSNLVCRL